MKQTKQDVKYILKRILIGVGIAVVLFNLKKCNVYALSVENFYYPNSGKVPVHGTYSSSTLGFEYTFNENDYILGDLKVIFKIRNLSVFRPDSYVIFENTDGVVYLLPVDGSPTDYNISVNESGYYCQDTSQNNTCNNTTFTELVAIRPDSASFPFVSIGSTSTFTNTATGSVFAYGFGNPYSVNFSFNKDVFRVIDTNIPNLTIDNTNWDEYYDSDPLKNYTEVDITGYQAILITPKNYLQISNTDGEYEYDTSTDRHSIIYKFGYQRCVRPTFINIQDPQNFYTIDSWIQGMTEDPYGTAVRCADDPTLLEESILYTSPELQASDNPYLYYGILVYNDSINYDNMEPNWVNNQVNPYGANSVWINTNLYNYYFVSSFSNFNQTITYTDANGDTQTTNIESLPTFNDMIDASISNWQDNSYDVNTSRVDSFLTFLKLPFSFLRGLRTDSCSPITLPLPKLGNVTIPCIKSLILQFLGSDVMNIVQIIINGLIIYRVTISNIGTLQNALDPVEDKLEVLEL